MITYAELYHGATGLTCNYTLVTNDAHFERIPGLKVENWTV